MPSVPAVSSVSTTFTVVPTFAPASAATPETTAKGSYRSRHAVRQQQTAQHYPAVMPTSCRQEEDQRTKTALNDALSAAALHKEAGNTSFQAARYDQVPDESA
jgi:hypothetical protein